jgi:hypothetical protein
LSKALKRTAIAKSAVCCVSDPDLSLLALKHKKSRFSQATSNGTKGCFAYFFSLGKK